tara:strand:- start:346 stop:666 length:321 start_codon:yes stop_codon:yes gene_type:complete
MMMIQVRKPGEPERLRLSAFEFDKLGFEDLQDFAQIGALFEYPGATEHLVPAVPGTGPADLADCEQGRFVGAAENRKGCGARAHINGIITPLTTGNTLTVHLQKPH